MAPTSTRINNTQQCTKGQVNWSPEAALFASVLFEQYCPNYSTVAPSSTRMNNTQQCSIQLQPYCTVAAGPLNHVLDPFVIPNSSPVPNLPYPKGNKIGCQRRPRLHKCFFEQHCPNYSTVAPSSTNIQQCSIQRQLALLHSGSAPALNRVFG